MAKELNPKQARFVEEYLKDANGSRAAIAAGYSIENSRGAAYGLLQSEAVKTAIEEARIAFAERAVYNLESAMKETEDAIGHAILSGNANAHVKAVELRAKLNALLVERIDVRQSGFVLNISTVGGDCPKCGHSSNGTPAIEVSPHPRDDYQKQLEEQRMKEQTEREAPSRRS